MTHAKSNSNQVIVIGGGIAGLATAALLAKQGWSVTILEKNSTLGGRARVLKTKGFSFDMGPSWYLMPEIFERFFSEFGKKTTDFYELIRLNPRYKIFFENKDSLTITDDINANAAVFERLEKNAGAKLKRYLSGMQSLYQAAIERLLYEDINNPKIWLKLKNWRSMFTVLFKVRLWESWQAELDRHFKHPIIKQILGFSSVFLGGSPFNTPSLFSLLVWSDFKGGVWYPKGGMIQVVHALEKICRENQVTIRLDSEVTHIAVRNGFITGVQTTQDYFPTQIVVGATDLPWLETRLLQRQYQTYPEQYWQKKTMSISCLLIYLGSTKRYPKLAHHNFYFSEDWQLNFKEIFDEKVLPTDPSFYVTVRSKTDRTIVPKDAEELVILVPLPAKQYSDKELKDFTDTVITKIEARLNISITDHTVVSKVYTPQDFEKDFHAYQGSALGLAHTFGQTLWFRPDNRSRKVKGLYYAGQYTNPGVGVPMALVSAQLVSKMVGAAPNQNQAIFKKGSTTYYYSSLFFRGQIKSDVFTLYAYVRTIDDLVDRVDPKIEQLDKLWSESEKAWNGDFVEEQIVQQFIELAKRKHFDWEWIKAFWNAMRSDLGKRDYRNFEELETYMYGSAEVIGFMMAKVLDLPSKAMKTAALQGKAMQLLNFIRDVDEDLTLGRRYLQFQKGSSNDELSWDKVASNYLKKYFKLQEQAEKGYVYLPKKYLVPIKTAALMYKRTAEIIERDPMVVWEKKVKPKKWQVLYELVHNAIFL